MDKIIVLDKFPTHVAKTNNKTKENKMFKINNQAIYNGSLHKHARAIVMRNMHNWIINKLKESNVHKNKPTGPVQLILTIYTVKNHGSIQWRKGGVTWKYPSEEYIPTWDEDNLSAIWIKAIKDSLSEYSFWSDDNVYVCRGTNSMIEFVDDIEDRRIEIGFKKL